MCKAVDVRTVESVATTTDCKLGGSENSRPCFLARKSAKPHMHVKADDAQQV